ncbi:MAG: DUF3179 domain-containing (seleno)protein, partial [Candidatus Limnocylindria bacterium]
MIRITPAVLCLVVASCSLGAPSAATQPGAPEGSEPPSSPVPPAAGNPWPPVPAAPSGEVEPAVAEAGDRLVATFGPGRVDTEALDTVAASGDGRLGWLIADLLRFTPPGAGERALIDAFSTLTGTDPMADDRFGDVPWVAATNLLIGWDLPAAPGYVDRKATLFLTVEPAWEPFFADQDAIIDWRWVSWGGVLIDDREIGDGRPCRGGCIPALDDPQLTSADDGGWYADWRPVFGVAVGEEAVAFPKHIMEVHEVVNLTIGGRRVGLPYCTLCGSVWAFLTDTVAGSEGPLVLRTSGLLSRSNKIMYDLGTVSAFNTFTGRATSGPLREAGVVLEQVSVVSTSWGAWKAAHPETKIVAQDGGIGRSYADDPLEGRDEAGPIFPVGPVDPRLPAQRTVVGVIGPDGPAAFPLELALETLAAGGQVRLGDLEAVEHGGGLLVRVVGGD